MRKKWIVLRDKIKEKFKLTPTVVSEGDETPVFLMIGSMSGCSYKDALSYARGLAERYTVPAMGRIHVQEDEANNRFVYEIHEGGPEFSIIDKVLEELSSGHSVQIELVNGAYVEIEDARSELISLIYAADPTVRPGFMKADARKPDPIRQFCGDTKLTELFPEQRKLPVIGAWLISISGVAFIFSGLAYTILQTGLFDVDAMLTLTKSGYISEAVDNPVWQMEKAKSEASKNGAAVKLLKKTSSGWTWELAQ